MRIGFVGAGQLGSALALGLAEGGYRVAAVASRGWLSAIALAERIPGCVVRDTAQGVAEEADLVFLAVPDDAIASVAATVRWRAGVAAVHCSGAAELDVLAPAARAGAATASFHPLQTFADGDEGRRNLAGSFVALEGEEPLLSTLEQIARALGGRPLRLAPGSKVLYHASATLACNYTVTLVQRAAELWATFGVPQHEALAALLPLLRGTVRNLERLGLPQALTGPAARGDVGTVRKHVEALGRAAPGLASLYCHLGLETVPIAVAKGTLAPGPEQELRDLFASSA